ncbi:uncharacterized protein BDR25DRAFT_299372 [Lindgomyces ingoldianus]|uniref:Uncharacterized protein n=1 Tax=Lindgomyces ingoldianus TaxID=673940 RepID=A0ACB6RDZ9_9PLEO|nr:uncharacterized protein BDR25DRAFT_299372 [Lindgomyces ingoldianus]KAF2477421.1 hypothetical protein BDR25DRAFT_299372 [Lindgomyces ingoldianus]
MVSTRRGPVGENTPLSTPRSTRGRGKRALETEDTPISLVKRRKSVVKPKEAEKAERQMDDAPEQTDQPESPKEKPLLDVIKVRPRPTTPQQEEENQVTPKARKLPVRQSPRVLIRKRTKPPLGVEEGEPESVVVEVPASTQDTEYHTPGTRQASSIYATPATALDALEESLTPKAEHNGAQSAVSSSKCLARQSKGDNSSFGVESRDSPEREGNANTEFGVGNNIPLDISSSTMDHEATSGSMPESDRESTPVPPSNTLSSKRVIPDEIPTSTLDSEKAAISTQESLQNTPSSGAYKLRQRLIRFASEEPVDHQPTFTPTLDGAADEPPSAMKLKEDDESDSDEAPDIVTAASAFSKTQAAEAEAARAFKAQQEKEKLKRKERAERIVEEQEQKKRREEKKAKKLAKAQAKQQLVKPEDDITMLDIHNLPALLPDSILEAAGDKRPPTPPPLLPGKSSKELQKEKLNRHIKFLERGEKPIKSVKKGPVNVHVLAQQNMLLAPKVNRDTRNIREHWLKGRQVEKKDKQGRRKMKFQKMERRAIGHGFIRSED